MPISIDGSGTITGISAGGLPDGVITTDDIAAGAVTTTKIANSNITAAKLGSGLILKVQHFTDPGSTTSSTSYTNANGSLFSYTPVSTSSTLILIATFKAQIGNVTSVNAQSFHAIGESSSVVGSGYVQRAFSSSGGIGMESMGVIQVDLSNTALTARSFQMLHAANSASQVTSTQVIRMTIMEVAS